MDIKRDLIKNETRKETKLIDLSTQQRLQSVDAKYGPAIQFSRGLSIIGIFSIVFSYLFIFSLDIFKFIQTEKISRNKWISLFKVKNNWVRVLKRKLNHVDYGNNEFVISRAVQEYHFDNEVFYVQSSIYRNLKYEIKV